MMIGDKFNIFHPKPRILVAPLDWGLGHAARCIPIIRELQGQGCEVLIAGERATQVLLQQEFPGNTFIPLHGYRVQYSRNKQLFSLALLFQIPKILITIYEEHRWLKKVVKKYAINAIISDNRFGLYHPDLPSVYITHQLLIKTGANITDCWVQKIHYWFIKKYSVCWVPDFEGPFNLAGALSHPAHLPPNTEYIGCLSRFDAAPTPSKQYNLLLLLSGPEPQRSILENRLLDQLAHYAGKVLLVRGLPGIVDDVADSGAVNPSISIVNHLPAEALCKAIGQSGLVICRSGYTSIMDLVKLKQPAILIPTPGQTEQAYLADHLLQQKLFFSTQQEGFNLAAALEQSAAFRCIMPVADMEQYKKVVQQFVRTL